MSDSNKLLTAVVDDMLTHNKKVKLGKFEPIGEKGVHRIEHPTAAVDTTGFNMYQNGVDLLTSNDFIDFCARSMTKVASYQCDYSPSPQRFIPKINA